MPEVLPIRREMFPELRDGILRELNPNLPAELWERAFSMGDLDQPSGYALTDGSTIVGLLGMIFSRRWIEGREERFCNLHSWYVRPEFRPHSLTLLRPLADMREVTITDLSASGTVQAISQRFGFSELDRMAIVMPRLVWSERTTECEIIDLDDATSGAGSPLNGAERAIQRDHSRLDCLQVLVRDLDGYCYIVCSRVRHGILPAILATSLVHFVSDSERFVRHHAAIRAHLTKRTGSQCVVVDSRLLAGVRVPASLRVPAIRKLFRSTRVRAEQVDGLYSEQVCFKLSTLPRLRELIRSLTGGRTAELAPHRAPVGG
jgi:hypothetical protein